MMRIWSDHYIWVSVVFEAQIAGHNHRSIVAGSPGMGQVSRTFYVTFQIFIFPWAPKPWNNWRKRRIWLSDKRRIQTLHFCCFFHLHKHERRKYTEVSDTCLVSTFQELSLLWVCLLMRYRSFCRNTLKKKKKVMFKLSCFCFTQESFENSS